MAIRRTSSPSTPLGFDDLVLTCCHIRESERPVRFVSHEPLGWVFTCGRDDHWTECWGMAHAYHFTHADTSLVALSGLRVNGQAARLAEDCDWLLLPDFETGTGTPGQSQSR